MTGADKRRGSVAALAGTTYAGLALSLITAPILARALGPDGRGAVAAVLAYQGLLVTVVSFGVPIAVAQSVASGQLSQGEARTAARRFSLVAAPVTVLLGALILLGPLSGLERSVAIAAAALLLLTPLAVLGSCWQSLLLADGALRPLSFLRLLPFVLTTLAVVALALAGVLRPTVYLAAVLAISLVGLFATSRYLKARPAARAPALKPLLHFGARASVGTFSNAANARLDQAILAPLISPTDLGLYVTAVTIASLPLGLGQAVASRAFGTVGASSPSQRSEHIGRYVRLTVLASVAGIVALGAVSPILVPLIFGEAFSGALSPLYVLLPASLFLALSATVGACLVAVGRPGAAASGDAMGLVVTAIGLPVAVHVGGLVAVATVSLLAYCTTASVQVVALRSSYRFRSRPGRSDLLEGHRLLMRLSTAARRRF